jgi:hypothetical protein
MSPLMVSEIDFDNNQIWKHEVFRPMTTAGYGDHRPESSSINRLNVSLKKIFRRCAWD